MLLSVDNMNDEEVRTIAGKISDICLSSEFQTLKRELETIYHESGIENSVFAAFCDALYTLLSQDEELPASQLRA